MDYLSLFSGIEAASVAWAPLGWRPLAFAEVDAFPSAVLRERFPSVPNLGDVTKVNWRGFVKDFGRPDVLVGGSPCQSFSIAGTRTGLGGGERTHVGVRSRGSRGQASLVSLGERPGSALKHAWGGLRMPAQEPGCARVRSGMEGT